MTALDDALNHARSTRLTPDEWLQRTRDGYRGKPYAHKNTAWYRAVKALERAAKEGTPAPAPAPPKPPPSTADPRGVCAGPGLWMTWGFHSDGWTPERLVNMAADWRAKWVAVDLADVIVEGQRFTNILEFQRTRAIALQRGIEIVSWGHLASAAEIAARCNLAGSPLHIAQNEGIGQTEDGFPAKFRAAAPNTILHVVASPWDGLPNPLVDPAGFEKHTKPWLEPTITPIHVEAYTAANPAHGTPGKQAFQAQQRGWDERHRMIVLETHQTRPLSAGYDAAEVRAVAGRAFSAYILEKAQPGDREWFRELAA